MKKISIIVGIVLILASFLLAFVSDKSAVTKRNNQKLIEKYVKMAEDALKNQDMKSAEKYVKMAVAVDPNSKEAWKAVSEVMQAGCAPKEESQSKTSSQTAPQPQAPSAQEEDEEDMGC